MAREDTTDESRLKIDLSNSGVVSGSPAGEYRGGRTDLWDPLHISNLDP